MSRSFNAQLTSSCRRVWECKLKDSILKAYTENGGRKGSGALQALHFRIKLLMDIHQKDKLFHNKIYSIKTSLQIFMQINAYNILRVSTLASAAGVAAPAAWPPILTPTALPGKLHSNNHNSVIKYTKNIPKTSIKYIIVYPSTMQLAKQPRTITKNRAI